MIYNELPIAFPWYEKKELQNRYNENTQAVCDYKLISPRDALLPFQFIRDGGGVAPTVWQIYEVNSEVLIATITPSLSGLRIILLEGKEYYTYDGSQLFVGGSTPLALDMGYYYSKITWPDGGVKYSEMFHVPEDGIFSINADNNIPFIKLEWWNEADIRPVFFNDKRSDGKPYFRNIAYLDTFITASEPEIIEDGNRDGNDELIATFQKALIKYRVTVMVPDFLKKAMAIMQLHDHVVITTKNGLRSGEITKLAVTSALEASGALSVVDIIFQEIILLKKGCGENMKTDCQGSAPTITNVVHSGTDFVITGSAPAGTIITLYRQVAFTSSPELASGVTYTDAQLLLGITVDQAAFYGGNYIVIHAGKFGCDFGFSNVVAKPV